MHNGCVEGIEWAIAESMIVLSTWLSTELGALPAPTPIALVAIAAAGLLVGVLTRLLARSAAHAAVSVAAPHAPSATRPIRRSTVGSHHGAFRGGRGARAPGAPQRRPSSPALV